MSEEQGYSCDAVVVTHADENEIKQFIQLGAKNGHDFHCMPWHQFRTMPPSDLSDRPHLFLIGKRRAHEVDRSLPPAFIERINLLVSNDPRLLSFPDLLNISHHLLIAPFSDTALNTQINALMTESERDAVVSDLMSANIIGESGPLKAMLQTIARMARYDAPALLHGETGTGKELVARALHYESHRCDKPFVPANCGALSDDLLLGQLFGYEKGAFTDAKQAHAGYVQQANGGTLFLDEVDSLSIKAQSALLRFLQEQEYTPLGSDKRIQANVRIVSATNRNLSDMVASGAFREDLFYRLHILDVTIPPLRVRGDDIRILSEYFLSRFSQQYNEPMKYLHPNTLTWMQQYEWPGNIRELENYLYRIAVLAEGDVLYVPDVKGNPVSPKLATACNDDTCLSAPAETLKEAKAQLVNGFERRYLHELMTEVEGNVSEAARRAGTERRVLGRLLKKHGIDRHTYHSP